MQCGPPKVEARLLLDFGTFYSSKEGPSTRQEASTWAYARLLHSDGCSKCLKTCGVQALGDLEVDGRGRFQPVGG